MEGKNLRVRNEAMTEDRRRKKGKEDRRKDERKEERKEKIRNESC